MANIKITAAQIIALRSATMRDNGSYELTTAKGQTVNALTRSGILVSGTRFLTVQGVSVMHDVSDVSVIASKGHTTYVSDSPESLEMFTLPERESVQSTECTCSKGAPSPGNSPCLHCGGDNSWCAKHYPAPPVADGTDVRFPIVEIQMIPAGPVMVPVVPVQLDENGMPDMGIYGATLEESGVSIGVVSKRSKTAHFIVEGTNAFCGKTVEYVNGVSRDAAITSGVNVCGICRTAQRVQWEAYHAARVEMLASMTQEPQTDTQEESSMNEDCCPTHRPVSDTRGEYTALLPLPQCQHDVRYGVWDDVEGGFVYVVDCAMNAANYAATTLRHYPLACPHIEAVCEAHGVQPADSCDGCNVGTVERARSQPCVKVNGVVTHKGECALVRARIMIGHTCRLEDAPVIPEAPSFRTGMHTSDDVAPKGTMATAQWERYVHTLADGDLVKVTGSIGVFTVHSLVPGLPVVYVDPGTGDLPYAVGASKVYAI